MDYKPKYTSVFESKAFFNLPKNAEGFVSRASMGLDELKSLLPDSEEILNNPDLLYTCFNAAVANLINLNGDGITTEGAKSLVASCKNKPSNIEHERSNVIGVITNYGFSSFGDNKILNVNELSDAPFNISLAAIVWKLCNRGFAEFIAESQEEDGFCYKAVSTSWEVGFDSYKLAVGSKDLRKAKIIDDPEEVQANSKYLLSMGGTGFLPTGEEVYRVIGDNCRFLGCAFTTNPAAAVQGVLSVDYSKIEDDREDGDDVEDKDSMDDDGKCKDDEHVNIGDDMNPDSDYDDYASTEKEDNFDKNSEKTSQASKNRVLKRMKYKSIDELVDNLTEAHASDVRDFYVSQVEKANEQYVALQAEKDEAKQKLDDAIASAESFKSVAEQLQAEVAQLRASIKAQEDQVKFSERMESLKEQYDIDAAASKTIAKKINGLSDEAFAEWLEDMKPLLKVKSQTAPSLESSASVNTDVPNSQAQSEDKRSAWTDTLKQIKITL